MAFAEKPAVYRGLFDEAALGGYDPVAYFTSGEPVAGRKAFEFVYMGATWRFASAENLAAFKADPEKYAPQFGGYCAWAVSQGYTAKGDPKNWRIVGGKLYLNYNDEIQKRWEKDIPGFITKANANWPKVLEK
ncbi:MAG TPA: YHS domain-containing (seleno)protein [Hyphomonadaceae bacterium]|nr:YHS domain-containing (seleno)protein [Hyphomonadaceae bacterium]